MKIDRRHSASGGFAPDCCYRLAMLHRLPSPANPGSASAHMNTKLVDIMLTAQQRVISEQSSFKNTGVTLSNEH